MKALHTGHHCPNHHKPHNGSAFVLQANHETMKNMEANKLNQPTTGKALVSTKRLLYEQPRIRREWAMPNKWTFTIEPIRKLICKYVGDGKGWIDPFAGENSPAEIRNDLNPNRPAEYHLEAKEFAKIIDGTFKGVLFDPPYSNRQIKECYEGIGLTVHQSDTQSSFYGDVKNFLAPKIEVGGIAISFGWNSSGFGLKRGFRIVEILLVAHGGAKNDTICTVEMKTQGSLFV